MNNLESVVRPFASGDVFTARILPPLQPNFDQKPAITQLYGNPITLQAKANDLQVKILDNELTEISRTTKTVRVSNPDDSAQFVDVEQITSMKLKDQDEQHWNFRFDPHLPRGLGLAQEAPGP